MEWADDPPLVSRYAADLMQFPVSEERRRFLSNPANWKCQESGMTNNIWLNLSTGYIGSGRTQWDGSGGTGASLRHYKETGQMYPLAVKLHTICPEGADVFSYARDELDIVIDPFLRHHLAHFGIDKDRMQRTESTTYEVNVDAHQLNSQSTRSARKGRKGWFTACLLLSSGIFLTLLARARSRGS